MSLVWNTVDQNHAFREICTETRTYVYSEVQFHLQIVNKEINCEMSIMNIFAINKTDGHVIQCDFRMFQRVCDRLNDIINVNRLISNIEIVKILIIFSCLFKVMQ